ncbi:hypothetical protein BCF55_0812 [Hydrogenivirga caldilitoris]|uniref:Uncharacterized protein n=1 Tax=Hydrogenivirga caldilitoris TaxID=246264 RepID=A0A497XNJ3_9AQUI|nr:hypothetical protein [Hydrogenivirga caldilitoris]RLJ70536.1 hypothetical protein BCF55_0812 [Hydrogenivirga caldilitoris]
MSLEARKKHNRKTSIVIAVMLVVFALLTYFMTFVIVHLMRGN